MDIDNIGLGIFQSPSLIDFWYLGLVCILFLAAWGLSKLKGGFGGLQLLGSSGLIFSPIYGAVGYFGFLILKKFGLVEALTGMTCFILLLPLFVVNFALIAEHIPSWKDLSVKQMPVHLLEVFVFTSLLMGAGFYFFYLLIRAVG